MRTLATSCTRNGVPSAESGTSAPPAGARDLTDCSAPQTRADTTLRLLA